MRSVRWLLGFSEVPVKPLEVDGFSRGGAADVNARPTFSSSWSNSFLRPVASLLWISRVSSVLLGAAPPPPPPSVSGDAGPRGSREGALCLNTVVHSTGTENSSGHKQVVN